MIYFNYALLDVEASVSRENLCPSTSKAKMDGLKIVLFQLWKEGIWKAFNKKVWGGHFIKKELRGAAKSRSSQKTSVDVAYPQTIAFFFCSWVELPLLERECV